HAHRHVKSAQWDFVKLLRRMQRNMRSLQRFHPRSPFQVHHPISKGACIRSSNSIVESLFLSQVKMGFTELLQGLQRTFLFQQLQAEFQFPLSSFRFSKAVGKDSLHVFLQIGVSWIIAEPLSEELPNFSVPKKRVSPKAVGSFQAFLESSKRLLSHFFAEPRFLQIPKVQNRFGVESVVWTCLI